jgi:hypothetical protein
MFRQTAVIADIAAARGAIDVKRTALLFDSIVVLKTSEGDLEGPAKQPIRGVDSHELEWLTEKGIISFERDHSESFFVASGKAGQQSGNRADALSKAGVLSFGGAAPEPTSESDTIYNRYREYRRACLGHLALISKNSPNYEAFVRSAANFVARYSATQMQLTLDEDQRAVPLMYDPKYILSRLGATIPYPYDTEAKADYKRTTATVLGQLPVPDGLTPWEDILEFRANSKSRLAFFQLREWIKDAAKSDNTGAELKDRIEYELTTLEAELKRARIKSTVGTIEIVVTSAGEVVENLLGLKFGEAAKALIRMFKGEVDTLSEEEKLAKHGLYYIVKAKEVFRVPARSRL